LGEERGGKDKRKANKDVIGLDDEGREEEEQDDSQNTNML